jgi:hypothetical protein
MSTVTGNHTGETTGGIFLYGGEEITSAGAGHGHHDSSSARGASAGGGLSGQGASTGRLHATANDKAHAAAGTAEAHVTGSIVWGNDGNDIGNFGAVTLAHDVLGTVAATLTTTDAGGNLTGVDPLLGPLQNNGGATATHALLPGSPAIDAGPDPVPDFPGNEFDQRGPGFPRVSGTKSDVGAFEVQPETPVPAPITITPKFTG